MDILEKDRVMLPGGEGVLGSNLNTLGCREDLFGHDVYQRIIAAVHVYEDWAIWVFCVQIITADGGSRKCGVLTRPFFRLTDPERDCDGIFVRIRNFGQ